MVSYFQCIKQYVPVEVIVIGYPTQSKGVLDLEVAMSAVHSA
jgi:hypothetical protein